MLNLCRQQTTVSFYVLDILPRLLICIKKSNGSKTEPCGMVQVVDLSDEVKSFTWQFWTRLAIYDCGNNNAFPFTP